MSLIRKLSMIGMLTLLVTVGCQKAVPLDPRDQDVDEELTRISREVLLHITSDYWGSITVSIVADGSTVPQRIATISNTASARTFKISKSRIGPSGRLSILLAPLGSNRLGSPRDEFSSPMQSTYRYILRDIYVGAYTENIWLKIDNQLNMSSATWR